MSSMRSLLCSGMKWQCSNSIFSWQQCYVSRIVRGHPSSMKLSQMSISHNMYALMLTSCGVAFVIGIGASSSLSIKSWGIQNLLAAWHTFVGLSFAWIVTYFPLCINLINQYNVEVTTLILWIHGLSINKLYGNFTLKI